MAYRYTEQDLADIKAKQRDDLSKFSRNSGRGLPEKTVQEMEDADGMKRDADGEIIPPKPSIRRPKPNEAPIPLEEEECVSLVQWANVVRWRGKPIAEVLIHIPNGAYLGSDARTRAITMGKLKAMGTQPGCFDYLVPVPIWGAKTAGAWIEMKRTRGGAVSAEQKDFRKRMMKLGYRCTICLGWEEAKLAIEEHLRMADATP